jgi:BioD-like phosphotransacetylase family protein
MQLPSWKLNVLHNEAMRQRAIDVAYMSAIMGGKESSEALEQLMKIHGSYTEGFYERELDRLREATK